jgi:hypothetical protein
MARSEKASCNRAVTACARETGRRALRNRWCPPESCFPSPCRCSLGAPTNDDWTSGSSTTQTRGSRGDRREQSAPRICRSADEQQPAIALPGISDGCCPAGTCAACERPYGCQCGASHPAPGVADGTARFEPVGEGGATARDRPAVSVLLRLLRLRPSRVRGGSLRLLTLGCRGADRWSTTGGTAALRRAATRRPAPAGTARRRGRPGIDSGNIRPGLLVDVGWDTVRWPTTGVLVHSDFME